MVCTRMIFLKMALCGHDETESSDNPGIFRGLVDFVASLDSVLEEHIKTATVLRHLQDRSKRTFGLHAVSS